MREYRRTGNVTPASQPQRVLGTLARIVATSLCLAGCSVSMPLGGIMSDDTPTGTIKANHPSPFSAEMDDEDWRRAKSALETALDPQGNGARVAWENPQSGAKGAFAPLDQPFPKDDGICRTFQAFVALKAQAENRMRSIACKRNGGNWIVGKVTNPQKADGGRSTAARKLA